MGGLWVCGIHALRVIHLLVSGRVCAELSANMVVHRLECNNRTVRRSPLPVVLAPGEFVMGGSCRFTGPADPVQPAGSTYQSTATIYSRGFRRNSTKRTSNWRSHRPGSSPFNNRSNPYDRKNGRGSKSAQIRSSRTWPASIGPRSRRVKKTIVQLHPATLEHLGT